MNDWLAENSGGSGKSLPGVNFLDVGSKVVGKILSEPRPVQWTDDEGKEQNRLVVELQVAEANTTCGPLASRHDAAAGEEVSLWIKRGPMARAVHEAVTAAGATGLAEGGTLGLVYTEQKPAKKGYFKLFKAEYQAPVPTVSVGESLI